MHCKRLSDKQENKATSWNTWGLREQWSQVKVGDGAGRVSLYILFLEYTGELRMIALRRNNKLQRVTKAQGEQGGLAYILENELVADK
jgi:hypothetical protein